MLTDPIADMLTRIRNANKALQDTVEMPTSRLKEDIARLLNEADDGRIVGPYAGNRGVLCGCGERPRRAGQGEGGPEAEGGGRGRS